MELKIFSNLCVPFSFTQVKNAPGSSADSPDSARALVSSQGKRWLQKAGATVVDEEGGESTEAICEISASISYFGEGLESFSGTKVTLPCYLDKPSL